MPSSNAATIWRQNADSPAACPRLAKLLFSLSDFSSGINTRRWGGLVRAQKEFSAGTDIWDSGAKLAKRKTFHFLSSTRSFSLAVGEQREDAAVWSVGKRSESEKRKEVSQDHRVMLLNCWT